MGLKLMLEKEDKIRVGDDTIITVMALGTALNLRALLLFCISSLNS